MKYTTDTPTQVGYYWMKLPDKSFKIVEIIVRPGHKYLAIQNLYGTGMYGKRDFTAIYNLPYKWAGPIPEPTDEEK